MSETAWTPGPWDIAGYFASPGNPVVLPVDGTRDIIAIMGDRSADPRSGGDVAYIANYRDDEATEAANAALIALAPELAEIARRAATITLSSNSEDYLNLSKDARALLSRLPQGSPEPAQKDGG